jgi:hypothetical protein
MAVKQVGFGGFELGERVSLRGCEKPLRCVERSGLEARLRSRQRTLSSSGRVGCEPDGSIKERSHGCESASGLRPRSRSLEVGRDALFRAGRGCRKMPRSAIGIQCPVGCLGERSMDEASFTDRRFAIDDGAHERMAEPHMRPDVHQTRTIRSIGGLNRNANSFSRSLDQGGVSDRLCCG